MPRSLDRPVLLRTAALLLGGALAGLGLNAARSTGVPLTGFQAPTTCTATPTEAEPVVETSPAAVSSLCGHAGVLFADARPAEDFAKGHIADAVHLPCDASASGAEGAMRKLGGADTLIVYGATTEEGREVAEALRARGLRGDVRVLRGGFAAWEEEGLACASGPCRECTLAGGKGAHP